MSPLPLPPPLLTAMREDGRFAIDIANPAPRSTAGEEASFFGEAAASLSSQPRIRARTNAWLIDRLCPNRDASAPGVIAAKAAERRRKVVKPSQHSYINLYMNIVLAMRKAPFSGIYSPICILK